jgi:hypothetical protein
MIDHQFMYPRVTELRGLPRGASARSTAYPPASRPTRPITASTAPESATGMRFVHNASDQTVSGLAAR